jgi:hypothetical protein
MLAMLVRNRIQDFDTWKRAFDGDSQRARAAGLHLVHLWRDADDPSTVVFLMEVMDRERAEEFLVSPESAAVGERAGVIEGDHRYLENARGNIRGRPR